MGEATLYQVEDGWIELVSGRQFYFGRDPEWMAHQIHEDDVAYALSRLCRYNGHAKRTFYVAEHTVVMADYVERNGGTPRQCLTALHHDDAEYIIGDLARPVKQKVPPFKNIENGLDEAVSIRFGTEWPFPSWLKELDSRILRDEREQVMNPSDNEWGTDSLKPLGVRFMPLRGRSSWWVRRMWLARHRRWSEAMAWEGTRDRA